MPQQPQVSSLAHRYRRASLVALVSAGLFGWCVTAAAPRDNGRFTETLHAAHRGPAFAAGLAALREPGGLSLNECSVCHADAGPVANLVSVRLPVADAACARCHTAGETRGLGRGLGQRFRRPAHATGKSTEQGLWLPPDDHRESTLACAACHRDHEGNLPSMKVNDAADRDRVVPAVTGPCLPCHIPEDAQAGSAPVLKLFAESHVIDDASFAGQRKWAADRANACVTCHGEHHLGDDDKKPK